MENILDKVDYEFNATFPELSDRKYAIVKEENNGKLDCFDKSDVNVKKEDPPDIFSDIQNFPVIQKENSNNRKAVFPGMDLKYLLSKEVTESDSKKLSKSKKEIEEEEREKMQVLVSYFTEEQLDRYEMFRRAAFPKAAIKRIMQVITGNSVSQNVVIAMSGIAKVFVGEIVEEVYRTEILALRNNLNEAVNSLTEICIHPEQNLYSNTLMLMSRYSKECLLALDIMEAQNDTAPLQPKHLREACRRLRLRGKIPSLRDKKPNYRF